MPIPKGVQLDGHNRILFPLLLMITLSLAWCLPVKAEQVRDEPNAGVKVTVEPAPRSEPFHGLYRQSLREHTKAFVICFHGISLCAQSYEFLADSLSARGFTVYSLPLRGFSYPTVGQRAPLDLQATVNDVSALVKELRAKSANVPIFLLGESMGANIALAYAEQNTGTVDGIICCAPAGTFFKQKLTALRSILIFGFRGHLPVKEFVHSLIDQATNSPELRKHLKTMPEHRRMYSLSEAFQFVRFARTTIHDTQLIQKTNTLVIQGLKDQLASMKETTRLFKRIQTNKTLVLIPGAEHLILEERSIDQSVLGVIEDFILGDALEHPGIIVGDNSQINKAKRIFRKAGITAEVVKPLQGFHVPLREPKDALP